MEFLDYYKILGVSGDADTATIKKSYRKLARLYHPDVSKEDNAEEQFKLVSEAWNVLKDKDKRAEFDQRREMAKQGRRPGDQQPRATQGSHRQYSDGNFDESLSDIFNAFYPNQGYGAQSRHAEERFSVNGQDINAKITVTLHDAYRGASLPLTLQMPVHHADGTIHSENKELKVTLPQGIINGQKIRLKGQGGPPIGGGSSGDLIIEVNISFDQVFLLHGRDVTVNIPLAPWEASTGTSIEVPTLGGNVALKIPENAKQGQTLRLKGRGLPGKPPGDQLVVLSVVLPVAENEDQKKLYKKMQAAWPDFNPRQIAS